jgi:hypothetical protein
MGFRVTILAPMFKNSSKLSQANSGGSGSIKRYVACPAGTAVADVGIACFLYQLE